MAPKAEPTAGPPAPDDLEALLRGLGDNAVHLESIAAAARGSVGLIPFVGAGLGIPFGLPGWTALLRELGDRYQVRPDIDTRLAEGRFEEAAEFLVTRAGRGTIDARLRAVYGEKATAARPLSGPLLRLPDLARGPVVTTNYDRLLERAFREAGRPFQESLSGAGSSLFARALDTGTRSLWKLHGDILDTSNRVLTLDEYDREYGGRQVGEVDLERPLPRMLRRLFTSRPLLFVGCSLGPDRTLLLLRRVVDEQGDMAPAHYALLEFPGEASWVERGRFLGEHRISPLWYPPGRHDLVGPVLDWLAGAGAPAGVPTGTATATPTPALAAEPTPSRAAARVPWRIDEAARRALSEDRPLLVLGPKQFGKTSYIQHLAAAAAPGAPQATLDLRDAEAGSVEGFCRWIVAEIFRGLRRKPAAAREAWETTFDDFAPAQRLTDVLETAVLEPATGPVLLAFENPGELPLEPPLDAELFSLLRRFSQYAREERTPAWRKLRLVVSTSTTPRAWERRLARAGLRAESSFFDLARRLWLRDLDDAELGAFLTSALGPGNTGGASGSPALCAQIRAAVGGSPVLLWHLLSDVGPDAGALSARLADGPAALLDRAPDLAGHLETVCARLEARPGGAELLARVTSGAALSPEAQDLLYAEGVFPQDGTGMLGAPYPVVAAFLARRAVRAVRA